MNDPRALPPAMTLPRPLDRAEAFFWLLDRVSSMNFAAIAEGQGDLDAATLAAALERARGAHPLLSAAIVADATGSLAFEPRPEAPMSLTEVSGPDWRERLADEIVSPFALGEAPLARAYRFDLGAGRWVAAIVFHHSIADGRSGCRLLLEVLADAGGAGAGMVREPLPPLHDLYPEHLSGDAGAAAAEAVKALRRAELKQHGRPDELPDFFRGPARPQHRFASFSLEADHVDALAARARAAGATVHGAIGAAQLIALQRRFGDGAPRVLGLTSPADLRPYLAAPVDDGTPGFYVTLLTTNAKVEGPEGFWPLAKALSTDLKRQLGRGDGHHFYRFVPPPERFPPTEAGIAAFAALVLQGPQASLLSNVGRLPAPPASPRLTVTGVSFALCPMPYQPLFTAVTTCGGRMTVNVSHDPARLAPRTFAAIVADVEELLRSQTR